MRMAKLVHKLRARLGMHPGYETQQIVGHPIRTRFGTVPVGSDYDTAWMVALIQNSGSFIDVGSNHGLFSLISCIENARRPVLAMDANPEALLVTAENLFLNGFSQQVRLILAFLSDTDGEEIPFFTVGSGAAGSRYSDHAKTASHNSKNIQVLTRTLDSVVSETGFQPDLVKIDVEGAETQVLEGARQTVITFRPRLMVEMHALAERTMEENAELVLQWCGTVGYRAYYLKHHIELSDPASIASRGRCHLLLLPANDIYPEFLKPIHQGDGVAGIGLN